MITSGTWRDKGGGAGGGGCLLLGGQPALARTWRRRRKRRRRTLFRIVELERWCVRACGACRHHLFDFLRAARQKETQHYKCIGLSSALTNISAHVRVENVFGKANKIATQKQTPRKKSATPKNRPARKIPHKFPSPSRARLPHPPPPITILHQRRRRLDIRFSTLCPSLETDENMQELVGSQILRVREDKDRQGWFVKSSREQCMGATSTKQIARVLPLPILLCDALSR